MEKWQEEALIEIKKKMRIVDGRNISAEDYPEKRDCYSELYKYVTEHNTDYNGKICVFLSCHQKRKKRVYIFYVKKPVICWKWNR